MNNDYDLAKRERRAFAAEEGLSHFIALPCRVLKIFVVFFCAIIINTSSVIASAQMPLQSQFKNVDIELRNKIAQMLFIDLRYYCAPKAQGYCQDPLLEVPPPISEMLTRSRVGGVILFGENLSSPEQIVRLTHDLQEALKPVHKKTPSLIKPDVSSGAAINAALPLYIPLYIGIDQEGGRVSRLPQSDFIGFAGNMAIGATAKTHKNKYAIATSSAIAKHLNLLGINVNFAPVIDVNSNPDNPIINVRAYGQFPNAVAELGGASIKAMMQQNISVAAKHFPGHGDTFIDSHVGLPRVEHSAEIINKIDLLPFRKVIASPDTRPDMIMTAHIQYPALDSTRFTGSKVPRRGADNNALTTELPVLPATLSRKILTGILRQELAYSGLIITDALNMRAITQYLTPTDAVIQSFAAGADITLMPFHISSPQDAIDFLDWLNELTMFIAQDNELKAMVNASYRRILTHKAKRNIAKRTLMPLADKLALLNDTAYKSADRALALSLSQASFTQIKGLAAPLTANQRLLVFMPDKLRCDAFEQYWQAQSETSDVKCYSILSQAIGIAPDMLANIDAVIVGDATPTLSFYESVDYEGIAAVERIDTALQFDAINAIVSQAKQQGLPRILVKLRTPYVSLEEVASYSAIFASYDYQVVYTEDGLNDASNDAINETINDTINETINGTINDKSDALFSPVFSSLVKVLKATQVPQGSLPVTLPNDVVKALPSLPVTRKQTDDDEE